MSGFGDEVKAHIEWLEDNASKMDAAIIRVRSERDQALAVIGHLEAEVKRLKAKYEPSIEYSYRGPEEAGSE